MVYAVVEDEELAGDGLMKARLLGLMTHEGYQRLQ